MRKLSPNTDPVYVKKEHSGLDRFFLKYINDEKDLPFIYLSIKLFFFVVIPAIILFTPLLQGWMFWVAATVYMLMVALVWVGPFTLMLHNTSHRRFFKREYEKGNYIIPWLIGPFLGQSPETYFSHHIGMHHSENNMEADRSSTLYYQRDSILGWLHYFGSFLLIGIIELYHYFRETNKRVFLKKVIRGEFTFIFLAIVLCFINWKATLVVFIVPFVLSRFGMMAGNWGQHAFIDAKDPENNYRNSITCINAVYNKKCFNDGYHIGHHLRPHMHWTKMPEDFRKNIDKYAENDAIVFEGIDFFVVWVFLMGKRYDKLADHYVDLNGKYKTDAELIEFFKSRTKRIMPGEWLKVAPQV